jgi:hypothetical protein
MKSFPSRSVQDRGGRVISPNTLTDGVTKVPKGCSEGFCHFWHLVTLGFSRNARLPTQNIGEKLTRMPKITIVMLVCLAQEGCCIFEHVQSPKDCTQESCLPE